MPDPFMPMEPTAPPIGQPPVATSPSAAPSAAPIAAPGAAPGAAMDRRVAGGRRPGWRRWRWAAVLPALAIPAWLWLRLVPSAGSLAVPVAELTIAPATVAPFQDYLPVRGTVAPLHTMFVAAIEGGQVRTVAVQDGSLVSAGQVLATLSNPQLELDVTSREAAITGQMGTASAARLTLQQNLATERDAIAEASYAQLKAQRDLTIRNELHSQGFESDAGVKSFADEAHYQSARVAMLRASLAHDAALAGKETQESDEADARLQHNLQVVQDSLQALTVRAPLAGRLTAFPLQPGQTLHQGDQVGQIDSAAAYRMDAEIDEYYLGRVVPGQAAGVELAGATLPMTVSRVLPQVANGQFRAELVFAAATPAALRRGQTADLRITLGATQSVLVVPNGPWLDAGGGNAAFVVAPDGRHAQRRAVSVGRRNPEQVEITAGLMPGDRVVVSATARMLGFPSLTLQQGDAR